MNPFLKNDFLNSSLRSKNYDNMTITGTINSIAILFVVLILGFFCSWVHYKIVSTLVIPILIVTFMSSIIIIFKKNISIFLAPIYTFCEGLMIGLLSLYFEKFFNYKGLILNTVFLTFSIMLCMLTAYKSGLLIATNRFRKAVILSMFAISIVYVIDSIINFFCGSNLQYIHNYSGISIFASIIIIIIAAFNFILDFDLIENTAKMGVPKYMEWYAAFSFMTTFVWLYFEVLRLFLKFRNDKLN
ncbi:MAG: Bax inhibitor-1/YccA family protein [Endomicrobium sp.]|jgi:uncharacterized YccA/Bax inhibitor family protein|nr:Bax inhibitor-1/YccA family protein [Endomicrobium sp.]